MRLWLAFLFVSGAAAHFEFRGYVKPAEATTRAYIVDTLGGMIKDEKFYLQTIEVPASQSKDKTVFFTAQLETDKDMDTISEKYKNTGKIFIAFWRQIAEINPVVEIAEVDLPDCKNGGTRLPNGTCACAPFTFGTNCETAQCQRKGIPDGILLDSCYCPPGWYAEYCEIRGCRPPLEDNLAVDTRSFLMVLPISSTTDDVRDTITQNIQATLNDLSAKEDGWIGTYLLDLIAKNADGSFTHYTTVSDTIDEFVANLRDTKVVSPQPSDNWPIMDGLVHIQQFTRKMNPSSIVVVFSDAGDTNAGPIAYTFGADNSLELQATQIAMLWRSRYYFFMLQTPEAPLNTTGDQYDTFRRAATFTHGDLFVINKNEITTVMSKVIPLLYRPEYIDVRSFANCGELVLDTTRDDPNQIVTVFITLDVTADTPRNWTLTASDALMGGTYLDMLSVGPYWAVFQVPPGWNSVHIKMSPSSTCSAKSFINSKSTLLWAYSDDPLIDVGNNMNIAEMDMMMTLNPMNFPLLDSFYVEFGNRATSNVFTWPMYAKVRAEPDCTYPYKIEGLPRCAVGGYNQKYTFTTSENRVIKRTLPGFCAHGSIKTNFSVVDPPVYPIQGPGTGKNCYLINPVDMGGKMHDFRQIIFAVEISTEMGDVVTQLKAIIGNVVDGIQKDNVKRQFSLVVFDAEGWRAVISDYDQTDFVANFKKFIDVHQARALPPGNGAFSLDAIYQAIQLEIVSPAQIHVFTKSSPKGSNHYWVLPIDVQVNWFFITDNGEVPSFSEMSTMQRQTGGRLISLGVQDLTPDFFISSVAVNNLIIDTGRQKCDGGVMITFQVEKLATSLEFTLLGASLNSVGVTDAGGKAIDKITSYVNTKSSQVFTIDPAGTTPGKWKLTLTTTGSCYAQVRAVSSVNVGVGFTSDVHSDFPARHPFVKRGTNPAEIVVVRATGSKQVSSVSVLQADLNVPWVEGQPTTTETFTVFNEDTCAYQYRADQIQMPSVDSVKVRVTGQDESGSEWNREFNYYTPDDDSSECKGGKSNVFGECACPGNFTGEYCWDPVCGYGSVSSKGICMCHSYYTGDRCENIRLQISNLTEPLAPPSTTTPFKTTTTTVTPTTTFSHTVVISWITVLLSSWML